jgi:hypothetical protein
MDFKTKDSKVELLEELKSLIDSKIIYTEDGIWSEKFDNSTLCFGVYGSVYTFDIESVNIYHISEEINDEQYTIRFYIGPGDDVLNPLDYDHPEEFRKFLLRNLNSIKVD